MFSTKELKADPRNHSVPIIEVIDDPEDDTKSYMVMPLLRAADSPPFEAIKEIIDFVDQILEVTDHTRLHRHFHEPTRF